MDFKRDFFLISENKFVQTKMRRKGFFNIKRKSMISIPFPLKKRGMDRPTDGPTDRPSCTDAWTHLKVEKTKKNKFESRRAMRLGI